MEGIGCFFDPRPVESVGMLVVAGLGLAINLSSMRILAGGKDASLNVKGAYLKVWATCLARLASSARRSQSILPAISGSIRWSPLPVDYGCCRVPGSFFATRSASFCKAYLEDLIFRPFGPRC